MNKEVILIISFFLATAAFMVFYYVIKKMVIKLNNTLWRKATSYTDPVKKQSRLQIFKEYLKQCKDKICSTVKFRSNDHENKE